MITFDINVLRRARIASKFGNMNKRCARTERCREVPQTRHVNAPHPWVCRGRLGRRAAAILPIHSSKWG